MGPIFRWLKINPDEIKLFLWSALLLLLVNVALILLNNYAETAFLKRFGVQYLPAITAINAVVTFFLLSAIGGRLSHLRGDKVVAWTLISCAAICGLLRFVVPFGFSLIYPLLYILKTQFSVLMAFLFWNMANDLFSTRQSKRLFPLITSGGILGGLLGSFATPLLIRITALDNLLLLFPLVAAAGAFCSLRLGLLATDTLDQAKPKPSSVKPTMLNELHQVAPLVKTSTLAQVLLLLTLLPNIIIPILNYQFSFVVNATFSSEASMIDFYSYFRGAQNTIALLLSLFVGRIYGRFGLPVALMFHPANYLLTFVAFLFQFNIFTAVYSGVSVGVLRRTINGPATAALYGLLLPKDRAVLRPFLRGTVVRIGILAGSGLLLVANEFIQARYLSLFAIVFSLGWLGATLLLKRDYSKILIDLVQNSLPDFHKMGREFKEIFKGAQLDRPLLERFARAEGEEARWCAEMLQNTATAEQLDDAILDKLPDADDETRILLLPSLSENAGGRVVETFISFRDPHKPKLMLALARTAKRVFAAMPEEQERKIFELAELNEVKACFMSWMANKDPKGFDQHIEGWISSAQLEDRRAAVLAIGEFGSDRHVASIQKILKEETEPTLLILALHSLQRFCKKRRVGRLIVPFLHHPDKHVRLAAIDSLPLERDEPVNALIHAMGDPVEEIRARAISRLEKLPADKQHLLVEKMGTNSRWTREGLFQVAATLELEEHEVSLFSRNQLKAAYETLELVEFIRGKEENAASRMMLEHLEEVRKHRIHNALGVMAARDPEGRIAIALRGLQYGGAREKSDSIEALEALLDKSLLDLLLPMLDDRPQAERLAVGHKHLGLHPLSEEAAVTGSLADPNWVSVVMMLECLAIWGGIEPYRGRIEELIKQHFGAVVHTAEHALNSVAGVHEEALSCLIERINIIRKVDLFQKLTIGQLAAVAWQSEVEIHPPDQIVASAEQGSRGLLMIVKGEIVFLQVHSNGICSDHELKRIESGDWFGAAALFGMELPQTMVAKSVGETLLIRIERETFHALANQYPALALQVCIGLSKVLGEVFEDMKSQKHQTTLDSPPTEQPPASYCATEGECSLVDYLFFLRRIDLFSNLDSEPLTALARGGKEIRLAEGEPLATGEGNPEGLYMVLEGRLDIYRAGEFFVSKRPGDYFGLPSLFGLKLADFRVKVLEKSLLLHISPTEFYASVMERPIIAIKACEKLSQVQGALVDELLRDRECENPPEEK